jgi:hypothetical protein
MYLQLGKEKVIRKDSVIGVFDLDITSQSHITRKFLSGAEKLGLVVNTAEDIPNSFLICEEAGKTGVYLVQAGTQSIYKKLESQEKQWQKN